jgi:hypothetical protein
MNCAATLFLQLNYNVLSPNFTFMYLWAIPRIGLPILLQPNADRCWEYRNHLQIHECRNWERGCTVSFLKIHKSDFRHKCRKRGGRGWNIKSDPFAQTTGQENPLEVIRRQDAETRRLLETRGQAPEAKRPGHGDGSLRKQLTEVQQQTEAVEKRIAAMAAELAARRQSYKANAPPQVRKQLPEIFGDMTGPACSEMCESGKIEELDDWEAFENCETVLSTGLIRTSLAPKKILCVGMILKK